MTEKNNIPTHIAFRMDGNGRWAHNKHLPNAKGHEEGARSVQAVVNAALKTGVKYITLYAFSTENWKRSKTEISALMKLLSKTLDKFIKEDDPKVKIIFSGRREPLPQDILAKMDKAAQIKKDNPALVLNLAINYGARQEITDAVNKLIDSGKKEITQQEISDALYNNLPEPDHFGRTAPFQFSFMAGGIQRILLYSRIVAGLQGSSFYASSRGIRPQTAQIRRELNPFSPSLILSD